MSKQSVIFISGLMAVGLLSVFLMLDWRSVVEKRRKFEEGTRSFNQLTKVAIYLRPLKSHPTSFTEETLVVFLNSECDHCQEEMRSLAENLALFRSGYVWLISYEPPAYLKAFLEDHKLWEEANILPFNIAPEDAKALFGFLGVPQTVVYDNNMLQNAFLGPIDLKEAVYPYFK